VWAGKRGREAVLVISFREGKNKREEDSIKRRRSTTKRGGDATNTFFYVGKATWKRFFLNCPGWPARNRQHGKKKEWNIRALFTHGYGKPCVGWSISLRSGRKRVVIFGSPSKGRGCLTSKPSPRDGVGDFVRRKGGGRCPHVNFCCEGEKRASMEDKRSKRGRRRKNMERQKGKRSKLTCQKLGNQTQPAVEGRGFPLRNSPRLPREGWSTRKGDKVPNAGDFKARKTPSLH